MKRVILLISTIMFAKLISAQGNLVPNPSLEMNTGCPNSWSQFYLVNMWQSPTWGTPDYYHNCGTFSQPSNWYGYQNAFGNAYAGLVVYAGPSTEYIQVKLSAPLDAGETYCVEYFVSLAEQSKYASVAPQAYFSVDSISSTSSAILNYTPHIYNPQIVRDTINWTRIYGEFNSAGGEQFLTIGNFISDSIIAFDTVNFNITAQQCSYYYVDSISVYLKIKAKAGSSRTLCVGDSIQLGDAPLQGIAYNWSTSMDLSDSTSAEPWIYPNQTTTYYLTISDTGNLYCVATTVDSVTIQVVDCRTFNVPTLLIGNETFVITALPQNTALDIFDSRGRLVYSNNNYVNDLSVSMLAADIYYYQLRFTDQTTQRGKFCVVK